MVPLKQMKFIVTKNVLILLIAGTILSISLAINSIFTTIRDQYIHLHEQILVGVVYLLCLLVLIGILIFIYSKISRRVLDLQKIVT